MIKNVSIRKVSALCIVLAICVCYLSFPFKVNAAAEQAFLDEPMDKQIFPYHNVRITWHDAADEHHYLISIRDITDSDSGPLIYESKYIAQNSTQFVIPSNKLAKGHIYRWSLSTMDAQGNRTFSPARTFKIEYGLSTGEDSHFYRTGYASASDIDYSLYLINSGYDSAIENAVNQ